MKFYIDFEATQPENEIIAIGAVAETGATFYALVKPQLSSISKYVSDLIHVSAEDLEKAKNIDQVMIEFDMWITRQEPDIMRCRFISYGNDSQFIKATLPVVKDEHAFVCMACMLAKIEDCSKEMFKFFHGTISLIHAFNYVQSIETKQRHNPLEDAMMLQKVYEYTQNNDPLAHHPVNHNTTSYNSPSGVFYCKSSKNGVEYCFNTCEEAIDWLIHNAMSSEDPGKIHRDRVMKNIMKAIRSNTKYCNYSWRRVKVKKGE